MSFRKRLESQKATEKRDVLDRMFDAVASYYDDKIR